MVHFDGVLRTEIVVTALAEYKKLCIHEFMNHRAAEVGRMLDEIERSNG